MRIAPLPAFLLVAFLGGVPGALAGPEDQSVIDWGSLDESTGDGDHVVGEEMCVRPVDDGASPLPSSGAIQPRR